MSAWALFAGLGCATIAASPTSIMASELEFDGPAPIENTVKLEIQISGLGPDERQARDQARPPGLQVQAPAPVKIAKGQGGSDLVKLETISIAATTTSADRDCSFEIVLTEPGRAPKTFRRGLQLTAAPAGATAAPSRTLKCYLPATTIAAKDSPKTTTPRR